MCKNKNIFVSFLIACFSFNHWFVECSQPEDNSSRELLERTLRMMVPVGSFIRVSENELVLNVDKYIGKHNEIYLSTKKNKRMHITQLYDGITKIQSFKSEEVSSGFIYSPLSGYDNYMLHQVRITYPKSLSDNGKKFAQTLAICKLERRINRAKDPLMLQSYIQKKEAKYKEKTNHIEKITHGVYASIAAFIASIPSLSILEAPTTTRTYTSTVTYSGRDPVITQYQEKICDFSDSTKEKAKNVLFVTAGMFFVGAGYAFYNWYSLKMTKDRKKKTSDLNIDTQIINSGRDNKEKLMYAEGALEYLDQDGYWKHKNDEKTKKRIENAKNIKLKLEQEL